MSLEPPTTAKVTLTTTKGLIKIDIFAKELPSTSFAFITLCHRNKFQNSSIQIHPNYISFSNTPPASSELNIPKESYSRIKCKSRGYVAYSNGEWIISRTGDLSSSGVQVFGKIDQESSWYVVNEIAQGEVDVETGDLVFAVTVESSAVDVPYFDLKLDEAQEDEEKGDEVPKVKKRKIAIDYTGVDEEEQEDEEENVIRIKSAYNTELKKKRQDKHAERETKKDIPTDTEREVTAENEENNESEEKDYDTSNSASASDSNSDSASDSDSDSNSDSNDSASDLDSDVDTFSSPLERDPTIDPPFNPKLDLSKAESITYSELKSHKFIINTYKQ
ncbi:CWC27 [Candida metapsilosis]|uniref:CWC27 n=1 Tax=Candida metapsilosis TaxID=273372 RepID=A0A8H7ZC14_9ASCO|nr:CWC27 [Candida metapsilosis]